MPLARRRFLKSAAALPLAPAALAPQSPPAAAPAPPTVAEALAEVVRRQFGAHLDAGDLEAVKKDLAEGLERGERLRREARLTNADEPVGRFEARPPRAPESRR